MANLKLLYSSSQIAEQVKRLAESIQRDNQGGKLLLVGILKGVFVFMADLVRYLNVPVEVDFLGLSSYRLGSQSSQKVIITKDLTVPIEGKNVLVVEDIIDTGLTTRFALDYLRRRDAASLKVCVLLDKTHRRTSPIDADYVGFHLEEGFVVGYGTDYAEKYRNLPDIYCLGLETEDSP